MLILNFYELKRQLRGYELLARRIALDDLSDGPRGVYKQFYGIYLCRNRESDFPQVWYYRDSILDPNLDLKEYFGAMIYPFFFKTLGNEEIHRKGHIVIIDLRGLFKMTSIQYLDFCRINLPMMESVPGRIVAVHFLVEKSTMVGFARSIQTLFTRHTRLRVQIHTGSWMEIQYSLRSFGIDIAADWLEGDVDGSPFSRESIRQASEEYRRIEEEFKPAEAPLCDPASDIALYPNPQYPNPQDVIMGKSWSVTNSWPGNLTYTTFMRQHAARYSTNLEKTEIPTKVLEQFRLQHGARFLTRLESIGWEVIPYKEARLKVGQSLRDEFRKMSRLPVS